MRLTAGAVLAAAALGVLTMPGYAQDDAPAQTVVERLGVLDRLQTIEVMAPGIADDSGEIAERFTQYGDNISPEVSWTEGPPTTRSYVLIMEDPIVDRNFVVSHWVVYNIPPDVMSLPEGVPEGAGVAGVEGAMQGLNIAEARAYAGPRPPAGDPAHNYTFQVFALDTLLDLTDDADREAVVNAMMGHILAFGQLEVPYTAPADAAN